MTDDSKRKPYTITHEEYFEKIYKEYFERLFAYALVITKSETLASEVVSDVFYNLWNSKIDLFLIKEIKAYLFTCTKNQALRTLVKNPVNFHQGIYAEWQNAVDKIDPEELLIGKELDKCIQDSINALPDQAARVFAMIRYENKNYQEAAQELGLSKDTVKYHMKAAMSKIRLALEKRYPSSRLINWYTASMVNLLAWCIFIF